jgi:hypothetical protein
MEVEYSASSSLGPVGTIVWLAVVVLMIVSVWKVFTKAGQPGWASIVPIYNIIVMLQVAGKPLWFIALFFVPIANIVAMILVYVALARVFGKGGGFAAGMIFLPFIFFPILGFGGATYTKPEPV